jgi:hypothetical protein
MTRIRICLSGVRDGTLPDLGSAEFDEQDEKGMDRHIKCLKNARRYFGGHYEVNITIVLENEN